MIASPVARMAAMVLSAAIVPQPAAIRTKTNPSDGLRYVWIHPGTYFTGCAPEDKECIGWERPRHRVRIEVGFWMGQTEVPQAAYQRVMGENPSRYRGDRRPVEQVDWNQAGSFCARVGLRLPIESEWEYAALGGGSGPRYGEVGAIAWFDGNSADSTHDVAGKLPNAYGLFDMLGNVWEWVQDVFEADRGQRLMKGGSFYNLQRDLRVPNRETPLTEMRHRNVGFRCVGELH